MILKRLLREPSPQNDTSGGGNVTPPAIVAASTNTTSPGLKETKAFVVKAPPDSVKGASFDASGDVDILGDDSVSSSTGKDNSSLEANKGSNTKVSPEKATRTETGTSVAKPETGGKTDLSPSVVEATPKAEPSISKSVLGDKITPGASRDYTGFTDEEQRFLKQMPNDAFNYTAKQLRDKKTLEKSRGEVYLQNPEAFRLDPAYKKASEDVEYLSAEAKYWQQQLLNVKAGKEYIPLRGWNAKGEPVFDKPQPPTDAAEIELMQRMQSANQAAQQAGGQLQSMQQGYTNRVQQDTNAIRAVQQEKFAWTANPELLEHKINVDGVGERTVKQVKEDFISLLPEYHRSNVLSDVSADMFVALQIYAQEIRNLKSQLGLSEVKRGEVQRAEPTSKETPGTSGVAKSKYGGPAIFDDLPPM